MTKTRLPALKYTDEEKERALTAVALCGGNCRRAAELLKQQGHGNFDRKTLWRWMAETEVAIYTRVKAEVLPRLKSQLADDQAQLAQAAAEIEAKVVGRLNEALDADEVEPKVLANLHKGAATAAGIHIDKLQLLNNEPTSIIRRDASEILRDLEAEGIVIDAEVVED